MTQLASMPLSMPIGLRSRKHINPFRLVQPKTLEQAIEAFRKNPDAALLAGGLDLIDQMKSGMPFAQIICLNGVPGLSAIRQDDDDIIIGAMASHASIAKNAFVQRLIPTVADLWHCIANPRIRYTGTVGGNLCSRLPHYDAAPALTALNAIVDAIDPQGERRTLPIQALVEIGPVLLLGIRIPKPQSKILLFDRSMHPALAVYLGIDIAGDTVQSMNVAIGGAYAKPISTSILSQNTSRRNFKPSLCADITRTCVEGLPTPISDSLCSGPYRLRMIEVQLRRLLTRFGGEN